MRFGEQELSLTDITAPIESLWEQWLLATDEYRRRRWSWKWPTTPGHYLLYGKRYSLDDQGVWLVLVKPDGSVVCGDPLNGMVVNQQYGAEGRWQRVVVPDDEEENT